jgi:hypothetical protein
MNCSRCEGQEQSGNEQRLPATGMDSFSLHRFSFRFGLLISVRERSCRRVGTARCAVPVRVERTKT